MLKFIMDEESSKKYALFFAAAQGRIDIINYLLKKGLTIDIQDEKGDTLLHYAIRRRDNVLIDYLLKQGAKIILNKKNRSPLLDAYTQGETEIAKSLTNFVVQKNSIKNIIKVQKFNKNNEQQILDQLVNDFIDYFRKHYIDRNSFMRFPAKHKKRAQALIIAARCCSSVKEFKDLLNNQLNLFKNTPIQPLPKELIEERWSKIIKNKPINVNKSQFYKALTIFITERFPSNVNNRNVKNVYER